jgi:hypothetical protein
VGPPDWGIQYPPGFHPGNPPERPQPQPPLTIWGPNDPRPTHPIVIPPPPPEFPANPPEGVKPPPPDGGWGYHPEYGWGYFPMTGGKPQPGPEKKK